MAEELSGQSSEMQSVMGFFRIDSENGPGKQLDIHKLGDPKSQLQMIAAKKELSKISVTAGTGENRKSICQREPVLVGAASGNADRKDIPYNWTDSEFENF